MKPARGIGLLAGLLLQTGSLVSGGEPSALLYWDGTTYRWYQQGD